MNVTGLRRLTSGEHLPFDPMAYAQEVEVGDPPVLDVTYDYAAAAKDLRDPASPNMARRDVFRWLPLLPVEDAGDVLPAGGTALVPAPRLARRFGLEALYLKDETRKPDSMSERPGDGSRSHHGEGTGAFRRLLCLSR